MPVGLLEAARIAQNNGEDKKAGVIMSFAEASPFLTAIPAVPIMGNAYKWVREATLGGASFRALNEAYTESAGETEELTEALKMAGGDLDVDNFHIVTGGPEIRTTKELAKAKALGQLIGYTLVKGAVVTAQGATGDKESFNGLQTRYGGGFGSTAVSTTGPNAGQLVANNGAADAMSVMKLDETILKVDNPTHLLMPKKQRINLTGFLRNSSSISTTRDEFGRLVTAYNGLPILDADINGDTAAIGYNENNDTTCSVYVLSLGADGLHLIQGTNGIDVRDLGEQDSKPVHRTRVEWYMGMVDEHKRCVARLYNIADVIAVA